MEDYELVAYLGRKVDSSMNDDDGEISSNRQESYNYYMGSLYGNERDGYSKVVTREVLETVEWAKGPLLKVFTAGDNIVSLDAVGPEDEQQAQQEMDIMNHHLMKENDGFMAINSWISDALMYPNGYVKMYPDEVEESLTENYRDLNDAELAMLVNDAEFEMTAQTPYESPYGVLYEVEGRRTQKTPKLRIEPVEPEQVLIDDGCTDLNLDEANFICHRVKKAFTDLVNEGYDQERLKGIGTDSGHDWGDERTNRLFLDDENPADDESDESMKEYWVHECYVRVDFDGDGLAERRRVVLIGDEIFENEESDYQPFVALCSLPLSHKHAGLSLADLVKDLQLIKSTLMRQLLDNVYKLNVRRKYVGERALTDDGETLEALEDTTAEIIPCLDETAIREETVQPILGDILPVINALTDQQGIRTGVSPNMSLDPNVLQQSTAGAFMGALEQASQRVEMISRIFAETGFKWLMVKLHRLLREYMDKEKAYKIRGQWVNVNPSDWVNRENVTVNVGLGFNNKEQQVQLLMGLLGLQKEAVGVGLADNQKIYNTLEKLVEASGLKSVERYFNNPAETEPPEPQADPMAELLQRQMEIEAAGQALDEREQAMKEREAQFNAQLKARETEATVELKKSQAYKARQEGEKTDLENDGVVQGMRSLGLL